MDTLNIATKFVVEECCNCGILFAMTENFKDRKLNDHKSFYCPEGHGQHYTAKSESDKLREVLRREELERQQAEEMLKAERKAHKATKKQKTRLETRVANGVCPCCNRTFKQLARHMKSKHPHYQK